jgi:Tfp pilus assembly protein PilV
MSRKALLLPETRKITSARGFTIMEVALAATVLAFTLMGMIEVVEAGAQMLDLSRKQTLATQILHSEIDQLRLQSWPVVAGYTSTGSPLGNGYPAGPTTLTSSNDPSLATFIANYPQTANIFTLTRTVACVQPTQLNQNPTAYSSAPLLLQVTFTISWTGVTGQKYSRVSTTYVGYNGLYQAYQRS